MKIRNLTSNNRTWFRWASCTAAGLLVAAVAGCGGGSSNDTTAAPVVTPPPVTTVEPLVKAPDGKAPVTLSATTPPATLAALTPTVTVGAVTINSPPVVTFAIADNATTNNAIIGLGYTKSGDKCTTSSRSTNVPMVPLLANFSFGIAKLVPRTDSVPSHWVNYIVATPQVYTSATDKTVIPQAPTRPGNENYGTLKDNGNGTYTYTFANDITKMKDLVASLTDAAGSNKADLGGDDLAYDRKAVHRLTIQISGEVFGTGSTTADCSASGVTSLSMANPVNVIYDFIPDTGKAVAATDPGRDIVNIAKCNECHNKLQPHAGRVDTRYCVICHTDQRKYGRTASTSKAGVFTGTTYIADGEVVPDFPVMIHKFHFGSNIAGAKKLTKTGYNYANILPADIAYPQNPGVCTKCHDGTTGATNATPQGDNYKAVPSRKACGACHDGIKWADGTGTTLSIKPTGATTNTNGHIGGAQADDSACQICHKAATVATYHSKTLASTSDVTKRTMAAEITGVAIDVTPADKTKGMATTTTTGTGSVTVTFKLTDGGVAVDDRTKFKGAQFTLAKLNFAKDGSSTNWQSYTGKARTTVATKPPVYQSYSEAADGVAANTTTTLIPAIPGGTFTSLGGGVWTYKFALINGSTAGDIRTISKVMNLTSLAATTDSLYTYVKMAELPNPTLPDTTLTTVSYDWWKTHRVGMTFTTADGTDNASNAVYDWVPTADPARPAQTRNIVSMNSCATCHGGVKIHRGYQTELCVTCHNQHTGDPSTGDQASAGAAVTFKPVDFQRIVHALHRGGDLPSVTVDKSAPFNIGGASHSYAGFFPGIIQDCAVCHSPTATKADGKTVLENAANWYTTPTKRACSGCHNDTKWLAHMDSNIYLGVEQCTTCHNATSAYGLDVKSVHKGRP